MHIYGVPTQKSRRRFDLQCAVIRSVLYGGPNAANYVKHYSRSPCGYHFAVDFRNSRDAATKFWSPERRLLTEQLADELGRVLLGEKIPLDVVNGRTGEIIIPANRTIKKPMLRFMAYFCDDIEIDPSPIRNRIREIITSYQPKFKDLEMAEFHLAEQGDAATQYEVGWQFFHGHYPSIKLDLQRAKTLFRAASDHGHIGALVAVGICYARESNVSEAKRCFQKAAEIGSSDARFCLAAISPDSEAIPLYYTIACEGHPLAQTALGDRLDSGNGVDQDTGEAAKWYKLAAERGDPEAQRKLADCYAKGWMVAKHSSKKPEGYRYRQAAKWYLKAAKQGDTEARAKIADYYASDVGGARYLLDEWEAVTWYH